MMSLSKRLSDALNKTLSMPPRLRLLLLSMKSPTKTHSAFSTEWKLPAMKHPSWASPSRGTVESIDASKLITSSA